tara:strand:- start:752 stop:1018 length:267 start_codon:yes stop_codon:yes gene_type:complete
MNNKKTNQSKLYTSQDYEDYLKAHIKAYCVSEFLGRGKYNKMYFKDLSTAQNVVQSLKKRDPLNQSIIYGISRPPHTTLPVNVTIEDI